MSDVRCISNLQILYNTLVAPYINLFIKVRGYEYFTIQCCTEFDFLFYSILFYISVFCLSEERVSTYSSALIHNHPQKLKAKIIHYIKFSLNRCSTVIRDTATSQLKNFCCLASVHTCDRVNVNSTLQFDYKGLCETFCSS